DRQHARRLERPMVELLRERLGHSPDRARQHHLRRLVHLRLGRQSAVVRLDLREVDPDRVLGIGAASQRLAPLRPAVQFLGWGLAITQQVSTMFLAWYVYNDSGQPVWYVATITNATSSGGSGTVFRTTGPPFSTSFNPNSVQSFAVGNITVTFTDGNNGRID